MNVSPFPLQALWLWLVQLLFLLISPWNLQHAFSAVCFAHCFISCFARFPDAPLHPFCNY